MHALCEFYVEKQKITKHAQSNSKDNDSSSSISQIQTLDEDDLSVNSTAVVTAAAHNNLDEPLSLIEKTALRVKPILEEVMAKMIGGDPDIKKRKKKVEADMRIVLGYLNQSELIQNLNIGNIMQIQILEMSDLLT